MTGQDSAFRWLLAWGVMIVVLSVINRTRFGHAVIYYSLALLFVFLLVAEYPFIVRALGPLGSRAESTDAGIVGGE